METTGELLRGIAKGLLSWYDWKAGSLALYIGDTGDALAEMLAERSVQLIVASCEEACGKARLPEHAGHFDYIIAVGPLERELDPYAVLLACRKLLKPGGTLLLGMNNRLGLRYFCGDRDPYTGRNFDGIENYRRVYMRKEDGFQGRCYSQAELKRMLREAGWESFQFFSVLPDLYSPNLIFSEGYTPNEDLANRLFPVYNYPQAIFLEEEGLYSDLIENGLFHQMASAYLIECAPDGWLSDVCQVTSSMERGQESALLTVIHKDGVVEKRAAYPKGQVRLERLAAHSRDLAQHGISVVEGRVDQGVYTMPYVHSEVGQIYLKRLLKTEPETFLQELDHFRDLILQSSEHVKPDAGDGQGVILRRGYVDMVPLNSFYQDGTFVFYDQEFCQENYPANAIIFRMLATFYSGNLEFQKLMPFERLLERYGLAKEVDRWRNMEWQFLSELRKEKELWPYHELHWRNGDVVNSNRQRMNYSAKDYDRLFVDIFHNADTRKLILFGSGAFAQRFLALYRQDYPVYAIIDNSCGKWGQELEGVPIRPPEFLRELQSGEYKVLVCIKNYLSVMKQLDEMGVAEYSIFDPDRDYPRKRKPVAPVQGTEEKRPKKYHTGYIAGVFDLFHVGHLNMFKRAKEQCDYLIVGVVTDEGVRKFKKTEPVIPFVERIELVRACRYVDEAVEIPLNYRGTRDAWRLHHFDCQFSGSDYADDPGWLAEKEFLEKHGAEMVFFPYTEGTSSSKIKKLIQERLL